MTPSSLLICALLCACFASTPKSVDASPSAFWSAWSDGAAEVSTYQLTQPRYGELRSGELQLIYVTEPFSKSRHVKVDRYQPDDPDHTIALKLNIVESWRTGVYEYRVMTSHFLDARDQLAPLKVTFSSQEWCGITYEESRWTPNALNQTIRSYFEGESREEELSRELRPLDQLLVLTRGLLRGGPKSVKDLPNTWIESAKARRLSHLPLTSYQAEVTAQPLVSRESRLGEHQVVPFRYRGLKGRICTLYVEADPPYRVIEWSCDDGERAVITSSARMPYWRYTREGDETRLAPTSTKKR